jgi:hypothetical protein
MPPRQEVQLHLPLRAQNILIIIGYESSEVASRHSKAEPLNKKESLKALELRENAKQVTMTKIGESTPRIANRSSPNDSANDDSTTSAYSKSDAGNDTISNGHNTAPPEGKALQTNESTSRVLFDLDDAKQHNDTPQESPQHEIDKIRQNSDKAKKETPTRDRLSLDNPETDGNLRIANATIPSRRKKTTKEREMALDKSKRFHKRKRGRPARVVSVELTESSAAKLQSVLPGNQYTTTLYRRAVRKSPGGDQSASQLKYIQQSPDVFGDVSLGMKLIVVGGKVVVQNLNALADGYASPAQLAGIIRRGDVLLAIGSNSLVNLPVDQLMEGLRPLSTPGPGGYYERVLELRFEAAAGLDLLKVHEEGQVPSNTRQEPADAMFSLFPMVDQLSGSPLFDDHVHKTEVKEEEEVQGDVDEPPTKGVTSDDERDSVSSVTMPKRDNVLKNLDELISSTLAKERSMDRERYQSEYFNWREDLSDLLRRTASVVTDDSTNGRRLTQTERLALGKRILQITKVLETSMEEIDKGRDLRSFTMWSTNFSLRSGVSARRRFVIDSRSVRSTPDDDADSLGGNESVASERSGGSLTGVDADALLLGLAARDEIWRKQVLETLEKAIDETEHFEDEEKSDPENDATDINEALTQELGNFLFGDMTKIVKHEKRSFALPPSEITRVLFDLTTNLAAKTPDEITVFGTSSRLSSNVSSFPSGTTRTEGRSRASLRTDLLLASRFVLDEALPKWLESFRPLPLEQRRILWPKTYRRPEATTSTFTGQVSEFTGRSSDADTLTLDSGGAETLDSSPNWKKGIRELVEDQQIDSETKSETYVWNALEVVRRNRIRTQTDFAVAFLLPTSSCIKSSDALTMETRQMKGFL